MFFLFVYFELHIFFRIIFVLLLLIPEGAGTSEKQSHCVCDGVGKLD